MIDTFNYEIPFFTSNQYKVANWNVQPTKFFRHYVYERLVSVGVPNSWSVLATFMGNSVWHGVYPCYWILTP